MKRGSFPVDRCMTGVPGFDDICDGGFVRDSINVVLGGPGAGKSTFLLQFLWNGVTKFNENGLYVSFESDLTDVLQDAMTLGMDFSKYDESGKCKFIRLSPKNSLRDLKEELTNVIAKNRVRRVAIDPLSVFSMSVDKDSEVRQVIFDLISLLKRMDVTVLIADEVDENSEGMTAGMVNVRTQFVKFIADSLTNFYSSGLGGVSDRALRISKMRRTDHVRGPVPFQISMNGITVLQSKR